MTPRLPLSYRARGARVVLRAPRPADARPLHRLWEESRAFLEPWMPLLPPGEDERGLGPVARVEARIRRDRRDWRADRAYRLLVAGRDDRPLGTVALSAVVRGPFQNAYLGYWIGAAHARRGLMTEAVSLALALAFGPLGLHRVQAAVVPRNAASLALARRVGLREEGLARRYLQIAGAWEDHVLLARTAEEGAAAPRARDARVRV